MSTFTITRQSAWSLSLRSLPVRHPFASFFVLAFAGTWLLDLPLILGQDGLRILDLW